MQCICRSGSKNVILSVKLLPFPEVVVETIPRCQLASKARCQKIRGFVTNNIPTDNFFPVCLNSGECQFNNFDKFFSHYSNYTFTKSRFISTENDFLLPFFLLIMLICYEGILRYKCKIIRHMLIEINCLLDV